MPFESLFSKADYKVEKEIRISKHNWQLFMFELLVNISRKILTNCTNRNVIRILPPLIINKEHIDLFLNEFEIVVSGIG